MYVLVLVVRYNRLQPSRSLIFLPDPDWDDSSSACHAVRQWSSHWLRYWLESNMTDSDKGEQPRRKFVLNVWWLIFCLIFALTIGR